MKYKIRLYIDMPIRLTEDWPFKELNKINVTFNLINNDHKTGQAGWIYTITCSKEEDLLYIKFIIFPYGMEIIERIE